MPASSGGNGSGGGSGGGGGGGGAGGNSSSSTTTGGGGGGDNESPPPYLIVGTEVSAKFKGAFCEAKIKRVDKSVRCKLTCKESGAELVELDTMVRSASSGRPLALNEYKIGSLVYVMTAASNSTTSEPQALDAMRAAVLVKVTDQSSYTVVFNDGDERTLKRSFIRFKGERHYLDSETLNNAPLTHPEHFYFPIKSTTATHDGIR